MSPRRMTARDIAERGRTATPLELFFDLCFIVAVALTSDRFHHALAAGHPAAGVLSYAMVFFAIWWAWMNFTWFASAFDPDDVPYRLAALVQITGALVFAAGTPRAFDDHDFTVITIGYAVARTGLVANWIRLAVSYPDRRRTALRFAAGVTACEIGWLSLLVLPPSVRMWAWLILVPAELAVPVWAERAGRTPWHPRHIAERYGLFTLIVLGESMLAATVAVQSSLDDQRGRWGLYQVALGGLLTVFGMWWLYFAKPAHRFLTSNRHGFRWGYGHYLIFASGAAAGAGIAVLVDHAAGGQLSTLYAGAALTIPTTVFLLTVWELQHRPYHQSAARTALIPVAAVLVLAATFTGAPALATGLVLSATVAASVVANRRDGGSARGDVAAAQAGEAEGGQGGRDRG